MADARDQMAGTIGRCFADASATNARSKGSTLHAPRLNATDMVRKTDESVSMLQCPCCLPTAQMLPLSEFPTVRRRWMFETAFSRGVGAGRSLVVPEVLQAQAVASYHPAYCIDALHLFRLMTV